MAIDLPLRLFLNNQFFGDVVTYGYETPWAVGRFKAADSRRLQAMIAVCELQDEVERWPDTISDEADEARWRASLERRGLTEEDLEEHAGGDWVIQKKDGTRHEIVPPLFDAQGFITWLW